MSVTPKYLARPEELNRLLVTQAFITRSMKYGYTPAEEVKQQITERAARLIELAELLGYKDAPEKYVNDRIAAWLKANPLALSKRMVQQVIAKLPDNLDGQVSIQIGEPTKGGYFYQALADDCGLRNGVLHFSIPDSVAEHFRQQGRRHLQSELRDLLNASRN